MAKKRYVLKGKNVQRKFEQFLESMDIDAPDPSETGKNYSQKKQELISAIRELFEEHDVTPKMQKKFWNLTKRLLKGSYNTKFDLEETYVIVEMVLQTIIGEYIP